MEQIYLAQGYNFGERTANLAGWAPDDKPCLELYAVELPEDPALYIYAPMKPKPAE